MFFQRIPQSVMQLVIQRLCSATVSLRKNLLLLLLPLLLLITGIELSLGGSSPYTSTNKPNKNKQT